MKIIKTIALLLMTNVVFSQNNIVNKKRKIVKKNVRWIDIDSLMQTLPKDTYYYNKWNGREVKECKIEKSRIIKPSML